MHSQCALAIGWGPNVYAYGEKKVLVMVRTQGVSGVRTEVVCVWDDGRDGRPVNEYERDGLPYLGEGVWGVRVNVCMCMRACVYV